MKYAVAQLEGALLDAAVAKAEGHNLEGMASQGEFSPDHRLYLRGEFGSHKQFSPSTEWSLAGPIIERERISVDGDYSAAEWAAQSPMRDGIWLSGHTPLIAAMRAFVASKLGNEIELP